MWFLGLLLTSASTIAGAAPDGDPLVQGIDASAAANRDAFSSGIIRFQYGIGDARSAEAARKGDLSRRCFTDGLFALDGKMARFDCVFSAHDMVARRKKTDQRTYSSPISSWRYLTDGKVTLWDQINVDEDNRRTFHTSQISAGTKDFFSQFAFPLGLGNPDPNLYVVDKAIENVAHGEAGWVLSSVVDDAKLDGHGVVLLTFQSPYAKLQFWIDVERGTVPLKIASSPPSADGRAPRVDMEFYNDDLRQIGVNKGWLPFRHTIYYPDNSHVQQYIITEANFDSPPPASTFRLEFSEPRVMVNGATMARYPAQKVWDLRNLPSASAAGVRRIMVSEPRAVAPAMPGEWHVRPWWVIPVLIAGMLLVLAAGAMAYRRRRYV